MILNNNNQGVFLELLVAANNCPLTNHMIVYISKQIIQKYKFYNGRILKANKMGQFFP